MSWLVRLVLWFVVSVTLAGCGAVSQGRRPAADIVGAPSATVTVSGAVRQARSFDLAALRSLPATTVVMDGARYTGVSLWTLLNTVTGLANDPSVKNPAVSMYVVATGSDGYRVLVSLAEIDPNFGNQPVIVAYAVNGAGLAGHGMARLVVPGDVKPARSVYRLARLEVLSAVD